jgi:RND superfamily putative drug exporter
MSSSPTRKNLAARMGGWSAKHRWTALGLWIVFVIAAVAIGIAVGQVNVSNARLGDGESGHINRVIDDANFTSHAHEMVLVQSQNLTAKDAAFRSGVTSVIAKVGSYDEVIKVENPYSKAYPGQITKDGHSALVRFQIAGDSETAPDRIQPVMDGVASLRAANPDLSIREFGEASATHVLNDKINADFANARNVSLPLTMIILLIAFGALVAAGIPVLLAFSAVLATFGLNSIVSHVIPTVDVAQEVILMIGMAVGVDYSLFYLQRERRERLATKPADTAAIAAAKQARRAAKRFGDAAAVVSAKQAVREAKQQSMQNRRSALEMAASTSGQAVLISGFTVMIAMAGMLISGDATFVALGVASMLVVAAAMVGSLTGLPAILSLLGDRVERGRVLSWFTYPVRKAAGTGNRVSARSASGQGRIWATILDRVLRRPVVAVIVAGGLLIALAIPALTIKTETPTFKFLPPNLEVVKTYNAVQKAFPGKGDPATVAFKTGDVNSPEARQAIADFKTAAVATGQVNPPIDVTTNPAGTVAVMTVPIQGDGANAASQQAVRTLRDRVIPATIGRDLPSADVGVTGDTASSMDFNSLMKVRTPIVFAFVLGLAFLLMLVTFRSIVIPIKAILLNLLSVGAAYGVLVLIFQHGIGQSLLGFHSTGTIANWLPLFLFVILFGLSMDYHVFILSRVKELVDNGMATEDAVTEGIKDTAGTVTSAAIVMVGVFGLFATLSVLDVKQLGVGAAAAVLIDATVIRGVLLPATMKLLGDWNWYLPSWLEWLPTLTSHGSVAPDSGTRSPIDGTPATA